MNKSEINFIELEKNLYRLVEAYKKCKEERDLLKEEMEVLNENLKSTRLEVIGLKDENEGLKVANALLGDEEHRRLMKLRVNKLIKELDVCIAQVKNKKG